MTQLAPFDHPWIDSALLPILVNRLPSNGRDEQLARFLVQREAWIQAATAPYGWVVDMTDLVEATAQQRRMFTDHLGRVRETQKRFCFGVAVIAPKAWMRGVLTAITWLQALPYPVKTFATPEEGLAWVMDKQATGGR